jgi:hypothetical protein
MRWDEIDDVEPRDFTIATMPARFAELGDLHAGIDDQGVFDIDALLEWADRDEDRTLRRSGCGHVRGGQRGLFGRRPGCDGEPVARKGRTGERLRSTQCMN